MGGNTTEGSGLDVSFEYLLDNLEFGAMGAYQARRGRWSIMTDIIYLDVANVEEASLGILPVEASIEIELQNWVVHAGGAYELWSNSEGSSLGITFGARYLNMSVRFQADLDTPLTELDPGLDIKASDDVLDLFVGLHGAAAFGESWFIPWSINAGAGDSKLNWAANAGVGYKLSTRTEFLLTYRHHEWELEDTLVIEDLSFSGPMLGAVFKF